MGLRDQARVAAAWLAREGAWRPGRQEEESRSELEQDAGMAARVREQVNLTAYSANPTQEDYYWGRIAMGAEEDYYWRRLSDNWYQKDVIPSTYLEIHNQCYEAYNSNPLANYIVEITTNFVLGNGLTITAASRRAQKIIDRFWADPDNHMATRVYSLCTELSLYGEQFIRFFVNPYDGHVKIAQIDPSMIDQIETDPENIEKVVRVHRRPQGPGQNVWRSNVGGVSATGLSTTGSPTAGASNADARSRTPAARSYNASTPPSSGSGGFNVDTTAGEWLECPSQCMQFAINKVSNAKRGKSDLATLLPWLRRYKDWLTDRVRINKYKGAFLWTIKLTGADRKTIDRKRMEYSYPPDPGSIVVHNESEEWSAVQPNISADDVEADGRAIKMMIAMGAGLPEHYLAEGGHVNYATAAEMGLPTFRKFQRRQDEVVLMIRAIVDRVLDEAVKAGTLPAGADRRYDVNVPALVPDDNTTLATAASTMANTLALARDRGWISDGTAMKLLFGFANVPVDVEEERARIAHESRHKAGGSRQNEGSWSTETESSRQAKGDRQQ
jgi:hypothetical protein